MSYSRNFDNDFLFLRETDTKDDTFYNTVKAMPLHSLWFDMREKKPDTVLINPLPDQKKEFTCILDRNRHEKSIDCNKRGLSIYLSKTSSLPFGTSTINTFLWLMPLLCFTVSFLLLLQYTNTMCDNYFSKNSSTYLSGLTMACLFIAFASIIILVVVHAEKNMLSSSLRWHKKYIRRESNGYFFPYRRIDPAWFTILITVVVILAVLPRTTPAIVICMAMFGILLFDRYYLRSVSNHMAILAIIAITTIVTLIHDHNEQKFLIMNISLLTIIALVAVGNVWQQSE